MRIAFLGLPLAAVLLARDGHDLAYAGLVHGIGQRRVSTRLAAERTEWTPDLGADATLERLRAARPELIVSWFWTRRIPARVLALAPAVGVHPSLLPRHRGPDPYFWAIDAGDATTGVTAHRLSEDYDTGPILAQRALALNPRWDAWTLARALDRPSLALLREVVGACAAGHPPPATPQDEALATLAPSPSEEDLAIRWSWPAGRIERRVRAAAPWPGVWTEIGEELVVLVRSRVTRDFPRVLLPGEAAVRPDGVAVVRAGEDALELLEGRAEDDQTVLGVADFAERVARAKHLQRPVHPG
jgi:methionyl-tRNA formyltransferase